jgi:hypothetical protein
MMSKDKKYEDGICAINRIKLLMEYSLNKTYTENLQEQPDSKMPFQIEKFGYVQGNPETLGPALQKQDKTFRSLAELDSHDWLLLISITTGILGMIPSPLSLPLLGISFVSDVSDAVIYYNEGDKYTSGILFALSIIPFHQLVKEFRTAYTFKKIGSSGVKKLIGKSKAGTITKEESKVLKESLKELGQESDVLVKLTKETVKKTLLSNLGKKSLKYLANLLYFLGKLGFGIGKEVGKFGIQIGGIYYLFDEIYLAIFANDLKNLDIRKYSKIQQLVALIKKDEEYFKELLIRESEKALQEAFKKGNYSIEGRVPNENPSADLEKFKQSIEKRQQQEISNIVTPPSFDMVLTQKINPSTNRPYTINKGQQGDTIKKLQKLLIKLGYEDMLSGYLTNETDSADGIFGNDTELVVKTFQGDNNLVPDGIVGQKTLKSLIEKTK